MPKKRNSKYWETIEKLNYKMQEIESSLVATLVPIISLGDSKSILEIEKEILSATEKFFEELDSEFLDQIAQVTSQLNNEINYQISNDGWFYNTPIEIKKEIDQATYETFKKCQDYLQCVENIKLNKSATVNNDFQYKEKIIKFIRHILKSDLGTFAKLSLKESMARDNVYWQDIIFTFKNIENIEKQLQNYITVSTSNDADSVEVIYNTISIYVKQIQSIINSMDLKTMLDKRQYSLLTKYSPSSDTELSVQKVKDKLKRKNIKYYYKKYNNIINQHFLNKEILSLQHKEKLAQKLEKELKSLSKDELKAKILKYFKEIKEEFFDIFNEKLNNFQNSTKEINFNYKKRLKELNQRQDINLTDEQKNQLIKLENYQMKSKRLKALNDFEKEISLLLPKLDDFTTYGYHTLQVFRNQLLINKDISPEIKKQYQEISSNETFIKFRDEIKKNANDVVTIIENVDTLHEHFLTLETENEQKKISEALITGIIQKQDYFVTKNSGKKLDKKTLKKISFLEDQLLVNKKLNDINRAVNEWDIAINKLANIKKAIKKQKPFKNLTTVNKNKIVSKNGILDFKPFPDDNANRRAQFIIGAEFRKTKITEYLLCFNMKKHTFEDTFGKCTKLEKKKKSIWDKIFPCINWLKQIKISYHKLQQSLNPKLYLKNDINAIKKSIKKLYYQCDVIKVKYARLMVVPLKQRTIFSINKTDNYYLMQAQAEIEKTISQFENKNKEKIKFYERWAEKQASNYDSNGRTMQKIKTIFDDFTKNPIIDANNHRRSKYQFANIEELNTVLEDRVTHLDFKPSELNENMKEIIECANGLGLSDYVVAQFKEEDTFFPTHI